MINFENQAGPTKENQEENPEKLFVTVEKENKERLEEWDQKNDEEKEREIKTTKGVIREEVKKYLVENPELIEDNDIEGTLKSDEKLENLKEKLSKETEKISAGMSEKAEGLFGKMKDVFYGKGPNILDMDLESREDIKKSLSAYLKITKNSLSNLEISYLMLPDDFSLKEHEQYQIDIEQLRETIKVIEEFKNLLDEFDGMSLEEQEEVKVEKKKTLKALLKKIGNALIFGIAMGSIILDSTFGKKSDELAEFVCGVPIPSWAKDKQKEGKKNS